MAIISIRNLVVEYDARRVLDGLNLDIEPGETSDPRFLQQLVPGSMKVTLGEREKKTQDIKIGR